MGLMWVHCVNWLQMMSMMRGTQRCNFIHSQSRYFATAMNNIALPTSTCLRYAFSTWIIACLLFVTTSSIRNVSDIVLVKSISSYYVCNTVIVAVAEEVLLGSLDTGYKLHIVIVCVVPKIMLKVVPLHE